MVTVDVERLVSAWLREQPEVTALVDDRVYTATPAGPTFPLVRLTLIDDRPTFDRPRYLTSSLIQLDAYGGPKVTARLIADTVCDLLSERFLGAHPDVGVVSSAVCSMRYLPDAAYDPARPRYVVDAVIHAHP